MIQTVLGKINNKKLDKIPNNVQYSGFFLFK